jgi:EmrB/QacA subfamily drug resistance transporter
MSTQTDATSQAKERLDPALIRLALVMLTGAVTALLDTTIVNVALHTIAHDMHASLASVQWVMTGYLLSFGMVIPLSGWALARFGGRATWLTSLTVFLVGSAAAGAAPNIGTLIAFRIVQGAGGGMLVPIFVTLLVQAAGGKSLGRLMATVSLPAVVVPIVGPVIGGIIIENIDWRWIFYVNIPIGVTGLILAWRYVPAMRSPKKQHLDITGLLLLSPAIAALLFGLSELAVDHSADNADVIAPLAIGAALLAVFTIRALRTENGLLDLRLFRVRSFTGASLLMFFSGLSMYGALFLLPLYYQELRGLSPLATGLLMAPQGIGSLLPRTIAGKLTDKLGPRPIVMAGMLVTAAATVPFIFAGAHTSELYLSLVLVARGAGLSSANIAVMAGAFTGLDRAEVPHASTLTRILQQVGGSFGTAVLAVILVATGTSHPFRIAFFWAGVCALASLIPCLLLPGRPKA